MNMICEAALEEVAHFELARLDYQRMNVREISEGFGVKCGRHAVTANPCRIEEERAEHAKQLVVQNVNARRAHQPGQAQRMHKVFALVEVIIIIIIILLRNSRQAGGVL